MTRREKLEQMIITEPNDPFLQYALAMELRKEGQVEQAKARFDQVLAVDPQYLGAYQQKAQILVSEGHVNEARNCLQSGVDAAERAGDGHAAEEMRAALSELNEPM